MTPIEIIALVLIVVGVLKMIMLLINPKGFVNITMKTMNNKIVTQIFGLILAGIIFYYLKKEFSVVDILAVASFAFAMIIIAFAGHIDDFKTKYAKLIKRGRLWQEYWLYTLIWIILMVWGVKELFF